ncbi:MAG: cytidine deaminase [Candidatus Marsarchaeota archaeon]|nr:cytidine deaminase [Candidatus Marsarchaeota archaeon]
MEVTDNKLIKRAKRVAKAHKASTDVKTGRVGCALITNKNHVYTGVSIEASCGIGFCAEHSAIASMATNREYSIKRIVAVSSNGTILPPCGRCRELMYQINNKNLDTEIVIGKGKATKLRDLLPEVWQKRFY